MTVLEALVREAVAMASGGRLPTGDELESHGRPGRALRAALDAARFDLEAHAVGGGHDRRGRRRRQCHDPVARTGGVGGGGAAGGRRPGSDAQAEGRRGARDRGPRRPRARGAGGHRPGRAPPARRERGLGPADGRGAARGGRAVRARVRGAAAGRRRRRRRWPSSGAGSACRSPPTRRVTSVKAARELLDAEAVDVLVVKPARVGGPGRRRGDRGAGGRARRAGGRQHAVRDGRGDRGGPGDGGAPPGRVRGPGHAARPRAGDGGPARARPVAGRAGASRTGGCGCPTSRVRAGSGSRSTTTRWPAIAPKRWRPCERRRVVRAGPRPPSCDGPATSPRSSSGPMS